MQYFIHYFLPIIDSNSDDELAVVRLTTRIQSNTTELKSYSDRQAKNSKRKGNAKTTYFKHFVETSDNEGKPIKVDGLKFKENPKTYDLTPREIEKVKRKVLTQTKQVSENNKKILALKKRGKKKR